MTKAMSIERFNNRPRQPKKRPRPGTLGWLLLDMTGGNRQAIASLDGVLASHPDDPLTELARQLIERFRRLSPDEQSEGLCLDRLAAEVGFPPAQLFGWIMEGAFSILEAAPQAIRDFYYPQVLAASYKQALKPANFEERSALLKARGDHFAAKGNSINIDNRQQEVTLERGLPDFDETINELHEVLNRQVEPASEALLLPVVIQEKVTQEEEEDD